MTWGVFFINALPPFENCKVFDNCILLLTLNGNTQNRVIKVALAMVSKASGQFVHYATTMKMSVAQLI